MGTGALASVSPLFILEFSDGRLSIAYPLLNGGLGEDGVGVGFPPEHR